MVGGAERQLYLWLSHLDRARFHPMVVTLKATPGDYWEPRVDALGIPLVRERHSGNPLLRLASLARILRRWRPELIHGWHLFASPYAGAVARMIGARSMGSLRSSAASFGAHFWEAMLTERLVDAMVVNSATAAAELAAAGRCRRQRTFVLPNAVEHAAEPRDIARSRLAATLRLSQDALWIGAMGRLVEGKGFATLLDAFAAVRRDGHQIALVLIGGGPLRGPLEAHADRLGVGEAVRFVGEDPSARQWLAALDLFCFLSEDEGMPNAVLEASAAAVPVVGWRKPFLGEALGPESLDGLVASGDTTALVDAMQQMLVDPVRRAAVGARASAYVTQTFGIAEYVERLSAAYDELLPAAAPRADQAFA